MKLIAGIIILLALGGCLDNSHTISVEPKKEEPNPEAKIAAPEDFQVFETHQSSLTLRWRDDHAAAGYEVFREGEVLATVPAGLYTFTDNAVQPGRSYEYQIVAFDINGKRSKAATLQARTLLNTPPVISHLDQPLLINSGEAIQKVFYQIKATDAENNPLGYTISDGNDEGLFAVDNNGNLTLAANADNHAGKTYLLTIDVSDGFSVSTMHIQLGFVPVASANASQGILRQVYIDSSIDSKLITLKAFSGFPDQPSSTSFESSFLSPSNIGSDYGQQMQAYLLPEISGEYFFWVASDDESELSLSTSAYASDAQLIAHVPSHTSPLQWNKYTSQASAGIQLEAGKTYFIRALMTEGGGADHLAVAWKGPGIEQAVIAGKYLRQPLDFKSPESIRDFTWIKTADDKVLLEWKAAADNVGVDHYDIYNGSEKLYTSSETSLSITELISGKKYNFTVVAVDKAGNRSASSRVLSVIIDDFIAPSKPTELQVTEAGMHHLNLTWQASSDDNNQPVVYRVFVNEQRVDSTYDTEISLSKLTAGTPYRLQIEAVDQAGNYSETDVLLASTQVVDPEAPQFLYPHYVFGLSAVTEIHAIFATLVATDNQNRPISYQLIEGNESGYFSVNDQGQLSLAKSFSKDESQPFNLVLRADNGVKTSVVDITLNVIKSSRMGLSGISQEIWTGLSGSSVADINFTAPVQSEQTLQHFKSPSAMGNRYGQRLRGYLSVPVTGTYSFWIASDDASELRISPDMSKEKAEWVARVEGYTSIDNWRNGSQVKTDLLLNAGQLYYIEALHKEGGGNDHLSVAWQGAGIAEKQLLTGQYLMPHTSIYPAMVLLQNAYQGNFSELGNEINVEFSISDTSSGFPVTIYYGEMDAGDSAAGWQYSKALGNLIADDYKVKLEHIEPGKTYYIRIETQGPAGSTWTTSVLQIDTVSIDPEKTAGEALPESIDLTVLIDGQEQYVELTKHSVRSPDFQLLTFDNRRVQQYQEMIPMPEPRTYRGIISNNPFVVVTGSVDVTGTVHLSGWRGDARAWGKNVDISHLVNNDALGNSETQTEALRLDFEMPPVENNRYYIPQPGDDFHNNLSRVSFKHEFPQFMSKADGNIINAVAQMEGHINELDYVWAQKTGLRWDLGKALIEVNGDSTAEGLQRRPAGRDNTNFSIEFQNPAGGGYCWGGGDWVGCVANYTMNWGFTHEIGHNMGLGHGEQTDNNNQIQQPGTHMGNMQSRKTLRRLQSGSKFKAAKAIEQPMLPAAFKDYLTVYKDKSGKLNPLDNDYDANGDIIFIESFDETTFAGGTVTAQENNLTYTPPANFVGVDQFTYTVTDGHYKTVGPVQIQVLNADLAGEWDMDTVTENKVTDLSGNGNHLAAPELDKITALDMLTDLLVGGIDNQAMSVQLLADDTKSPDALGHSLLPHKLDPGDKSFSASLWFQYSDISGNKLLIGKSSFHPNNMQYGGWEIRTGGDSGNDLTVQVSFRDRLMVNNQIVITQPSAIAEESWHHVVLVLDREAGELRGYLDGVAFDQKGTLPEGHGPIIAAMNTSSYGGGSPFKVGGHTVVNCQPGENEGEPEDCTVAAGQAFDHVKIYHKALTEEEVGTLYALQ